MEALKNHPLLETRQGPNSSLDVAVLHSQVKEMRTEFKMAPVLQTAGPNVIPSQTSNASLEIVVIHTKPSETLSALRMAADLASGLAPVRLLAARKPSRTPDISMRLFVVASAPPPSSRT